MSFSRYPEYKDSFVEWLGDVPSSWTVQPLKYSTQIYTGNSLNDAEKELYESTDPDCLPYISSKDIDFATHEVQYENGLRIPKEQNNLKIAYKGSFLLCIEGGSAGKKVALLSYDVCFVNKLCCFTSKSNNKFNYYFTQTQNFKDKFELSMTGLIGGVSTSLLKKFSMPTPSSQEQKAIVNFLDRETTKIDELVREQRQLIELLKEKRQAVISHAVTQGLNPRSLTKPSGIEWLGDVPSHWEVSRIKYHCSVNGRIGFRGYTTEDQVDEGNGALVLGATHITSLGKINLDNPVYISWEKYYESPEIMVEPTDVIVVQRGSTCGKIGYVAANHGPATINPSLVLLNNFACSPRLIFLYLSSTLVQGLFECVLGSTAIPMLSQEQIGEIELCLPPPMEQEEIIAYIDNQTAQLDTLIAEAQRAIDLLQERRAALISAAVTGKIDVRNVYKEAA